MAYEFATDAWVKALEKELNSSEAYRKAAKNWEGDFYFIVEQGQGIEENIYLYLDLWHGEARQAYLQNDPSSQETAFELSAPLDTWKGVLNKKIDPIRGIMSRQLKLKGPMMKIMKAPKAATELVECAARVDTVWPS